MKPINFLKIGVTVCLMFILLSTEGCVNDDLSVCGVNVVFKYTKNIDRIDKFSTDISKVNLYIFDSTGVYIDEYLVEGQNSVYLNIMPGKYDLIAWGWDGSGKGYELPTFVKNVTNVDEAIVSLKRSSTIVTDFPDNLYHGSLYQEEIAGGLMTQQTLVLDMMKDTKHIKVTARGIHAETRAVYADFACNIHSLNGDIRFDNSVTGNDTLHYIPQLSVDSEEYLVSDFVVTREYAGTSTGSKLVVSRTGGEGITGEILREVDLVPLLIAVSPLTGDIDIPDTFNVVLIFDYTSGHLTITIEGWEDAPIWQGPL